MMKSEVTMPVTARRRYTEEFKIEAVRLVRESAHPVAQVARDLGIPENVLYRWRAQHRQAETHGTTRASQRAEAEELTRVQRELARVTQERDFLKRAAAFFAKESR
jgi:transposase